MKKFILSAIILVSLVSVSSCRQDEDFSAEEQARIDLLQSTIDNANSTDNVIIVSDREPVIPPRK